MISNSVLAGRESSPLVDHEMDSQATADQQQDEMDAIMIRNMATYLSIDRSIYTSLCMYVYVCMYVCTVCIYEPT